MECQAKGPPGPRSYFSFTLIRFDEEILLEHYEVPVRDIDPDSIHFEGGGGMTNITEALETLYTTLTDYMEGLQQHEESSDHPLPLVILFSDGYQNIGEPSSAIEAAEKIKALNLDGDHVMVVTAGVSIGGDRPDEETLRAIAGRPNWYQHIDNVTALSEFIAKVGSSTSSVKESSNRLFSLGRRCQVTCEHKGDSRQFGDVANQYLVVLHEAIDCPAEIDVSDNQVLERLVELEGLLATIFGKKSNHGFGVSALDNKGVIEGTIAGVDILGTKGRG